MGRECRFCRTALKHTFVDLGMTPLSNAYLTENQTHLMEAFFPLHAYVCDHCFLVQLEEFEAPDQIFSDYAYFSSYSDLWLEHARSYTRTMQKRLGLNTQSQVVEIASNDGYLLQYFLQEDIPVLGIEPAANVAKVAIEKGIPTMVKFFGVNTAQELVAEGKQADLLLGNNVLAHVPDLNDFVAGMRVILKPKGVITMEFPHLLKLMELNQFDTIYHEHFSYFSLMTVEKIFAAHGLTIFDVEELTTHGGSLRIYARHAHDSGNTVQGSVPGLKNKELALGLDNLKAYESFSAQVKETKRKLLEFLIHATRAGKTVVGYGAPAKGNTLLNYCGVRNDFIAYTVDRSPHKQGRFLPGTHIPILHPEQIRITKPDYLLVLPWNLEAEITTQMSFIREWGGKFVFPIPEIRVTE